MGLLPANTKGLEVDKPFELDYPTLPNDDGRMHNVGGGPRGLKEWIDHRRLELGMTMLELAETAELSEEGIRKVASGERQPRKRTQMKIEAALRWAPGSVSAILVGEAPTAIAESHQASPQELIEELIDLTGSPEEAYDLLTQALLRRRRRNTPGSSQGAAS